jgi:hypothetical protein
MAAWLLPLAAVGIGSALQGSSKNAKQREQQRAIEAEQARQAGFSRQRNENFKGALAGFSDRFSPEAQQNAVANREQNMRLFMDQAPAANTAAVDRAGAGSGQRLMDAAQQQKQAQVLQALKQRGSNMATMGSTDDMFLNQRIGITRDRLRDALLARQAANSSSLLPGEAEDAYNNAGNASALFGNALTTLGTFGLGAGFGG